MPSQRNTSRLRQVAPHHRRLALESLERRELLAGDVVLSEIKIDPAGTESNSSFEYVEIRGVPGQVLSNMSFVSIDGDGSFAGLATVVVNLAGQTIGSNGLLVIKGTTGGHAVAPGTTVVTDARFNSTADLLQNGTNTFMLVRGAFPQGEDSDINNDGIPAEPLTAVEIVDSIGISDGGGSDRVYGGVLLTLSNSSRPHAVTRFLHDNRPLTADAWYGGALTGLNPDVTYTSTTAQLSANFPVGGVLTPGEVNAPGVNNAPVGTSDFYTMEPGGLLSLSDPALGVLANDADPDDALAPGGRVLLSAKLMTTFEGGELAFQPNGTFTYTDIVGTPRTVTFMYRATDMNLFSQDVTVTIQIGAAANQPPVLTVPTGPLVYVENGPPLLIDVGGDASVSDTDSTDFDTGKLTVRFTVGGTVDDRLAIQHQGTDENQVGVSGANVTYGGVAIGTFSGGGGTAPLEITFNAASSPAIAQAVLRRVAFQNVSDNPSALARAIEWLLTDGDDGTSAPVTTIINVTPENDAPQLALPGPDVNYAASAPAVIIDEAATVADVDSADFGDGSLVIEITAGGDAGDVLAVRNEGTTANQIGVSGGEVTFGGVPIGTVSGGVDGPLVIALNSSATATAVQSLARNITYRNSLPLPATTPRTVRFVLTDGDGGTSLPSTALVNVSWPPLPSVAVFAAAASEGHSGTTALQFAVTLSSIPLVDVVVTYHTIDGTATVADGDYLPVASGTLTFLAGATELTQNIAITTHGDNKYELDDQFSVSIEATGANVTVGVAQGTITNDDALPTVSIEPVAAPEGDSGTTPLAFTVSISHPSYQDIVVSYATNDGSATLADNDYVLASGSLTFPANTTPAPQTITVQAVGDTGVETTETFTLSLANTSAANATASATGTIENDDLAPPLVYFGEALSILDGLRLGSDSGLIGDRITSDATPTLWGTSEPGAVIRLYVDRNGNQEVDAADTLVAQTTADAGGQWQATLLAALSDGSHRLLVTAESAQGKVSVPAAGSTLEIAIDTQAPMVTELFITSAPNFDLFSIQPALAGPTPLVSRLTLRTSEALMESLAESPQNYELRGDFSGSIPLDDITFSSSPAGPATIVLTFARPLPDDRFTLTVRDSLVDLAGHALDGLTNGDASPSAPVFNGDGQPGGDFIVRFTVDSRAEVGTWLESIVRVDTNGNGIVDPSTGNFAQRDITYLLGQSPSAVFAGNFSLDLASNGFDKLATYAVVAEQHVFLVDVDHDGIADNRPGVMPAIGEGLTVLNISGAPVAGRFDNHDLNGDEVGVFDGVTWYFDTNHNFVIDSGDATLGSELRGAPIVGDFDGDGLDDLAVWADDHFQIDLARGARRGWDGIADFTVLFGFSSTLEQPAAADMNGDGIDDLGLYVPDAVPEGPTQGRWFFIVSGTNVDGVAIPLVKFDHSPSDPSHRVQRDPATQEPAFLLQPELFGDLVFTLGDRAALPVVGNFDPPVTATGTSGGVAIGTFANPTNPLDVDDDGQVTPTDAALVYNALNARGALTLTSTYLTTTGPFLDVSGDGVLGPDDALLIYIYLNAEGGGEAEAAETAPNSERISFAQAALQPNDYVPRSTNNATGALTSEKPSDIPRFNGALSLPALFYWSAANSGSDLGDTHSVDDEELEDLLDLLVGQFDKTN